MFPTFLALVNKCIICLSLISFNFLAGLCTIHWLHVLLTLQMFLPVLFLFFSFLSSFLFIHAVISHSCYSFICSFSILKLILRITQSLPAFPSFPHEHSTPLCSFSGRFCHLVLMCLMARFSSLQLTQRTLRSLNLLVSLLEIQKATENQSTAEGDSLVRTRVFKLWWVNLRECFLTSKEWPEVSHKVMGESYRLRQKGSIMFCVYYRPPDQTEPVDEVFFL